MRDSPATDAHDEGRGPELPFGRVFYVVPARHRMIFLSVAHGAPRAKGDLYKAGPRIVSRTLLRIILFFRNFVGHPLGSTLRGVADEALFLCEQLRLLLGLLLEARRAALFKCCAHAPGDGEGGNHRHSHRPR